MNIKTWTILIVAILALCSSCSIFMASWPPAVDPLKGWNSWSPLEEESHPAISGSQGTRLINSPRAAKHSPLDRAINDDYQNYLQKHGCIPIEIPTFYENGTGQHAIKVQIETLDRDLIVYIFIYDQSNTRTKVMKFFYGHTSC
jgi:hypothetical protein